MKGEAVDVELRHFRAFVAVAQLGSFTRAAESLHITQPAFSRTIKHLEDSLGVKLLERSTRHVALTKAGQDFLSDVRAGLGLLDQAVRDSTGRATVRLGFSWLVPDPWIQDTLRLFQASTKASVEFVSCADPIAALARGSVEVAVIRGHAVPTPGVQIFELFNEERVAVCSYASALAARESIPWDEIPDLPLVVNTLSGTTGPWSWPEGRRPETVIETETFDEWIESVAANRGVGVAPLVAQRRIVHPAIHFVLVSDAPPVQVRLACRKSPSAPVRRFVDAALRAALPQDQQAQ
ncbi:LysR family transcriptional regulator [Pseudarthrobacter sp. CC12]|uniref:LysR family transcriptional regulator n=1 Tax=Pseudarthrobacter sp. CC12 TaxID=3029193 RepID=UPI0032651BC5